MYADAEFDGIGVIDSLKEKSLSYLIRKSADNRVDRFVVDMAYDMAVKQSHEMDKTARGKSVTVTPTLIGVLSTRKEDAMVVFVTNLQVSDGDTSGTQAYPPRHGVVRPQVGIKNSYKSIKDFLAWTTSRNTAVRVFYFALR